MRRETMRYEFKDSVPAHEAEATFFLAVLAAEGLHGQACVRIGTTYTFDPEKRVLLIDTGTDVGRDICLIFTGLANREFGETSFSVFRNDAMREEQKEGSHRPA